MSDIMQAADDDVDETMSKKEDSGEALTDWPNEPTLSDLKQDYEDASSDHDSHVSDVDTWLDNLNVEGEAQPPKIEGRSSIQPKLIRKQAEWRYSSLSEPFLSTEDMFTVEPVGPSDRGAAIQNQLVLNNQFNTKIRKVKFINDYVRAAVDEGTVVVRVGWDFEEELEEVVVPVRAEVPVVDPIRRAQLAAAGYLPTEIITIGSETKTVSKTIKNQPTLEVCDYNNVIIDPTCMGDIDKANFVIFSFETSLSELKKDGKRYTNLDKINIENASILSEPDHTTDDDSTFNFTDKPRKKFVAYEYWGYWDINDSGKTEPFVATWVGDVMIRMEENPFPDKKIPFVTAQYLPIRRSIYGEPDGELLEDNQKIIGAVTRGMIDVMGRSANGQTGVRKDVLDVTNKRKFDRGLDYEFNGQVDPRQAFYMHTFPEIPRSAGDMLLLQNQEAESLTGVKAFSQGISGVALGENVGGIKSALDATAKRELDILRRLADGIIEIGRKIIAMNSEFLSNEEIIRITEDDFATIKREELIGELDLRLSISTPEADEAKAKELAFMLQTTGQTMGNEFSQLILANIARLRKMPALAKQIEEYQPTPDPLDQEIKMLEVQKLKAEIKKIESEALENTAEAQLDQAKARESSSKADKTDLDFIEQETGTTHARDVDRITSQANANTTTKIVENALKTA